MDNGRQSLWRAASGDPPVRKGIPVAVLAVGSPPPHHFRNTSRRPSVTLESVTSAMRCSHPIGGRQRQFSRSFRALVVPHRQRCCSQVYGVRGSILSTRRFLEYRPEPAAVSPVLWA
jgi:hypothetical protein